MRWAPRRRKEYYVLLTEAESKHCEHVGRERMARAVKRKAQGGSRFTGSYSNTINEDNDPAAEKNNIIGAKGECGARKLLGYDPAPNLFRVSDKKTGDIRLRSGERVMVKCHSIRHNTIYLCLTEKGQEEMEDDYGILTYLDQNEMVPEIWMTRGVWVVGWITKDLFNEKKVQKVWREDLDPQWCVPEHDLSDMEEFLRMEESYLMPTLF